MIAYVYLSAFFCIILLSIGQIFFKLSAINIQTTGSYYDLRTISYLFSALFLYGITSIAWVFILQKINLGKIYPIMALSFIIVPFFSFLIFNETFSARYFLGIALIILGIIISISNY